MPRSTRPRLVDKGIRTATEQLAKMPASPEVVALKEVVCAIEDELDDWAVTPPGTDEREGMMKKVMALHLAIAKLVPQRT